jgi:hypothetical protein
MACLKLTFGCFALIGLVVVVLVLALVGLFALGVHHMFDLPERASVAAIDRTHGPLLTEVRKRLADPAGLRGWRDAPKELVAVRHVVGTSGEKSDPDLLSGAPLGWASHTMLNKAGVATIDQAGGPRPCLLYEIEQGGKTYWLYLADPGPPASQGPE